MKLKELPEDFLVQELRTIIPQSSGKYMYFLLKKKNKTTPRVAQELAKHFGLSLMQVGYAGNKDKHAVTEQFISLPVVSKDLYERLRIKDVTLTYMTHADERITLGDLEGNKFVIVVRAIEQKKELQIESILNYFDDQRFGVEKNNAPIGKLLLQANYADACKLLNLTVDQNDPIKALRTLDRKTLRFYVHSYQSYLWNTVVAQLKEKPKEVPLLGFLTELKDEVKIVYEQLLEKEGIVQKDFLLPSLPELATEGGMRRVSVPVVDFFSTWEPDDLHHGAYKAILAFTLPPGAYATMVVKQLFGNNL